MAIIVMVFICWEILLSLLYYKKECSKLYCQGFILEVFIYLLYSYPSPSLFVKCCRLVLVFILTKLLFHLQNIGIQGISGWFSIDAFELAKNILCSHRNFRKIWGTKIYFLEKNKYSSRQIQLYQ